MTTQQEQMSKCVVLCQEHFGGAWNKVLGGMIDATVKPLSGGLSNYLYIASLPDNLQLEGKEPRKVLLRFYGTAQGDHTTILKDSLVFALLADRGLGPKFYGCFAGGRFEEYIPTTSLKTHELAYPTHMMKIANAMANFHLLDMPLCKEPNYLSVKITKSRKEVDKHMQALRQKPLWKDITSLNLDFDKELQWLIKVFSNSGSSVRFCHNDVQEGNILRGSEAGELLLIDFEYAAYNYRAFDVANHFLEWCYCYDISEPPYFTQKLENYPKMDQQKVFFHHYLEACGVEPTEAEIQKLYLETQLFILGPHFVWAFWSLGSAITSDMNFGYLEYALVRLKAYQEQKEFLQKAYPFLLQTDKHMKDGEI
ncbi:CHKB [Bugula neritina]|uniref:CHKB n=1 Tax=Bugula neritina TaxID=10212 RepID=A0A7J7JK12_BUGNE|nr:CHKB [Bugula neritina]